MKMQMNATTKTVRIAAIIAPPMPDHILEPLERYERIWFLRRISVRAGAITVCLHRVGEMFLPD